MPQHEKERQIDRRDREPHVDAYDPFAQYFVSQNNKNEFLKALESSTASAGSRSD